MMSGDESLEDDHPAGVGGALEERVGHLGDVHVGGVGGRHQVCEHRQVETEVRGQRYRHVILLFRSSVFCDLQGPPARNTDHRATHLAICLRRSCKKHCKSAFAGYQCCVLHMRLRRKESRVKERREGGEFSPSSVEGRR